jgi:hypothetical protein
VFSIFVGGLQLGGVYYKNRDDFVGVNPDPGGAKRHQSREVIIDKKKNLEVRH